MEMGVISFRKMICEIMRALLLFILENGASYKGRGLFHFFLIYFDAFNKTGIKLDAIEWISSSPESNIEVFL